MDCGGINPDLFFSEILQLFCALCISRSASSQIYRAFSTAIDQSQVLRLHYLVADDRDIDPVYLLSNLTKQLPLTNLNLPLCSRFLGCDMRVILLATETGDIYVQFKCLERGITGGQSYSNLIRSTHSPDLVVRCNVIASWTQRSNSSQLSQRHTAARVMLRAYDN